MSPLPLPSPLPRVPGLPCGSPQWWIRAKWKTALSTMAAFLRTAGPSSAAGTENGSFGCQPASSRYAILRSATRPCHGSFDCHQPKRNRLRDDRNGRHQWNPADSGFRRPCRRSPGSQRPADVVAEADRSHSRARQLSTARTARGPGEIPRIVGAAAQRIVRRNAQPHLGKIRAAERNRTGSFHPRDHRRIRSRHGRRERRQSLGHRARPRAIDVFLDGKWHAMKWPGRPARICPGLLPGVRIRPA